MSENRGVQKESRISLSEGRGLNFKLACEPLGYCVDRGLRKNTEGVAGYNEVLMRDNQGRDFITQVQGVLKEVEKGGQEANLLDVGCGRGKFLLDAFREWGEKLKLFGVTAAGDLPEGVRSGHNTQIMWFFSCFC